MKCKSKKFGRPVLLGFIRVVQIFMTLMKTTEWPKLVGFRYHLMLKIFLPVVCINVSFSKSFNIFVNDVFIEFQRNSIFLNKKGNVITFINILIKYCEKSFVSIQETSKLNLN